MKNASNSSRSKNAQRDAPHQEMASVDRVAAEGVEPWSGLLASAAPRDHIVQLYQDQQFLNRAVCRFAAAALRSLPTR